MQNVNGNLTGARYHYHRAFADVQNRSQYKTDVPIQYYHHKMIDIIERSFLNELLMPNNKSVQ